MVESHAVRPNARYCIEEVYVEATTAATRSSESKQKQKTDISISKHTTECHVHALTEQKEKRGEQKLPTNTGRNGCIGTEFCTHICKALTRS